MGLVPKKAMLDAAEFYIKKEKLFILEEEQKIRLVMWLLLLPAQGWDHERDASHTPPASQSGAEQRFGSAQAPGMTLVSRVDFGGDNEWDQLLYCAEMHREQELQLMSTECG